jgi:hypothetical protein
LQLPAHPFAFSVLDKGLGHYRRYTRKSVKELLVKAGFDPVQTYYFNFFGLLGWYWVGKISRKIILPDFELSIFNKLTPYLIKLDYLFKSFLGLNVIAIGKKHNNIK